MKLYLHPTMPIADAALMAFRSGKHLRGRAGVVEVRPGRDFAQAEKALKSKALLRLARSIERGHNK